MIQLIDHVFILVGLYRTWVHRKEPSLGCDRNQLREPYQVPISAKISKPETLPGTKKSENWKNSNLTRKFRSFSWLNQDVADQEVLVKIRKFLAKPGTYWLQLSRRPELLGWARKFENHLPGTETETLFLVGYWFLPGSFGFGHSLMQYHT